MVTITVEERSLMNDIIRSNKVCYVGMVDTESMPYVLPMNFGFRDDVLYLHSAQEGKSISSLNKNPNVCITICSDPAIVYQDEEVACSYRVKGSSVMCRGKVVFIEDYDEKVKALDVIMSQYTNKKFSYSKPSVENVKVWKVEIEDITTKIFGSAHPKSRRYKDQDFSQFY
ncbi:MAG: pyridoxamine 5'-phosphate oxidase family protein [Dysgonomonas sp.]